MRRPPTLASVNQRMTQQRRRNNLGDAEGAKEDLHGFSFRFSEIKLNSKRLMEILFFFFRSLSFLFFMGISRVLWVRCGVFMEASVR